MKKLDELEIVDKKYIIFDLDGTLIDSLGIWNELDSMTVKAFTDKNINYEDIHKERDYYLSNNNFNNIYYEYCDYLIERYNLNITKDNFYKYRMQTFDKIITEKMRYKENVTELIKLLYELKYKLIIATTSTKKNINTYATKNKVMMKELKIYDYFDLILTQDDVVNKKPNSEVYLKVLDYYNTVAEKCIIFEDSLQGIIAAKNAGIETINIYDKYSDKDRDLINQLCDYKINDFNEFINYVNDTKIKKLSK